MNLRKVVALSLVITLGTTCFTGCSRDIPKDDKKTMKDDVFEGMDTLEPEKGATLLLKTSKYDFACDIAKSFEKKWSDYNIKVEVEKKGIGLVDQLAIDGPAGTGADVLITAHDDFLEAMSAGLYYVVSPKIVDQIEEQVGETALQSVTSDGKIYGVPVSEETSCLFYNKDIVGDTPAKTFEEIYEKALTYNDYKNNKFYFLTKIADGYKLHPFLSAYGFTLFGKDGLDSDNPGIDSDEFEKGLEVVASLKKIMNINSADLSDSFIQSLFKKGQLAYVISGPWDLATFDKEKVNYGVTTLPTYDGKDMVAFAGFQNAHVSAYTDYPRAAQLLAAEFITAESASILYKDEKEITVRKDLSKVEGLMDDKNIQAFTKQLENAIVMPSIEETKYYWTVSDTVSQLVFNGEISPEEGRKKAISDWKALEEAQ